MRGTAKILLTLCLGIAVACAPLSAGKVLCTTPDGHRAIEMPHAPGGCHAVDGSETESSDHRTPCDDEALEGSNLACRHSRSVVPPVNYSTAIALGAPQRPLSTALALPPGSLCPNTLTSFLTAQQWLDSIVLVI